MKSAITRREFIKFIGLGTASLVMPGCTDISKQLAIKADSERPPNFVIIFTDDQGYSDVGCFGAKGFETPNLDGMAVEGMRFTDFYVAAPVCTPSRAALMTGCYPQRVSMPRVLFPWNDVGLNPEETTIADILKTRGYASACIGKWHLGHHRQFLPTRQGFDYYFGLPYSNDMRPENSDRCPPLPLIKGEDTVELNPDQSQLTRRYTEESIEFIRKNKDRPFFLYIAHTMPHIPLYVSEKFKGKSKQGLYGDVIMEIDWSVGQILSELNRLGMDNKTLVIFTSDNGPWLSKGKHGGSARPLRDGKGSTYEGGMRVPCIMRWPGRIPSGTICSGIATTMDFLPTFAALTGAKLSAEPVIDGKDISPLLTNPTAKTPHEVLFYYRCRNLQAVRSGKWKIILEHKRGELNVPMALYDLENDISEECDVAAEHPNIVKRLLKLADKIRRELGDSAKNITGKNVRPPGRLQTKGSKY